MQNKKTLITSLIIDRFIDNYSETEYNEAWGKLQIFINEIKHDKRLYSESAFDAEWIDEIFCNILGYPKKLKSRESWTTNGANKKEERIDGVFYAQDGKTIKMVIELKALDTTDLFKKVGKLSPITQGAKYLFQTPQSELAVVSNFDKFVIFDRKEEFRQSWSIFTMEYEQFKEFYLIMSSQSFYGGLTSLMIQQSLETEKDIDDDFYAIAANIYKTLHKKIKPEYADDLFNKFFAMAYLEDCSKLPQNMIKTVYDRKTDFDHSLKCHWDVFSAFFRNIKSNKSSRESLGISEDVAKMQVWQDTSYLGRVTIPKSILDQVVKLGEYNLKSISLDKMFFSMTKRIFNPFDGITYLDGDEDSYQFNFYKKFLKEKQYVPLNLCLSFLTHTSFANNHIINLYNQLSNNQIVLCDGQKNFSINVQPESKLNKSNWSTIINKFDLEDEDLITEIKSKLDSIKIFSEDERIFAQLNLSNLNSDEILIYSDGQQFTISKDSIKNKITIPSLKDKVWLNDYLENSVGFGVFGSVVDKKDDADLIFNIKDGSLTEKNEIGIFTEYEFVLNEKYEIFVKSKSPDLKFFLQSKDFLKYLELNDFSSLENVKFSKKVIDVDSVSEIKKDLELKKSIQLFEFKLNKLKNDNASEIEILRIEKMLDTFYEKEKLKYR